MNPVNMHEHRVIGPPGCGKTTYLARQVERASERYGRNAVMVASLTKAAAHEASSRTELPKGQVGTLHAHAFHALGTPRIAETGPGYKAWNEWIAAREPGWAIEGRALDVDDYSGEVRSGGEGEGEIMASTVALYRAQMIEPEWWPLGVQSFYREWCEFKEERGYLDFTDLLEHALEKVEAPEWGPRVMMLDEAQDHSKLEMALARKWAATCEQFVVVGDPDQNLYEWRGADPHLFTDGEPDSLTVLEQSYRVPRAVHALAVPWIEKIEGRPPIVYLPRDEEGEVTEADHVWQHGAYDLVDDVEAEVAAGRSVMVLASCGYMLGPAVKAMRERGVPFANPYKVKRGDWNPLRGAERLLAYLRPDRATWGEDSRPWDWEDVRKWVDPLLSKGVLVRGAKTLIESKAKPERFSEVPPAEIMTLLGLFEGAHFERAFDLDVTWWLLHHLEARRGPSEYPVRVYNRHGGAALRARPKVCIGTIHSVKGGEADTVFLFPDLSVAGAEDGLDTDPIRRLFYVAMTRARQKLVLCQPTSDSLAVDVSN